MQAQGELLIAVIEEGKAIRGWLQLRRPSRREIAYAEGPADAWFDLAEGLQEGDLNGWGLARVIGEGKHVRACLQGPYKRKEAHAEGQGDVMVHVAEHLREGYLPVVEGGPSWKQEAHWG